MSFGRIHCFVIATKQGHVVYERFYDALTEAAKAELRSAFFKVSQPVLPSTKDEVEHVGHFRCVKLGCSGVLLILDSPTSNSPPVL